MRLAPPGDLGEAGRRGLPRAVAKGASLAATRARAHRSCRATPAGTRASALLPSLSCGLPRRAPAGAVRVDRPLQLFQAQARLLRAEAGERFRSDNRLVRPCRDAVRMHPKDVDAVPVIPQIDMDKFKGGVPKEVVDVCERAKAGVFPREHPELHRTF